MWVTAIEIFLSPSLSLSLSLLFIFFDTLCVALQEPLLLPLISAYSDRPYLYRLVSRVSTPLGLIHADEFGFNFKRKMIRRNIQAGFVFRPPPTYLPAIFSSLQHHSFHPLQPHSNPPNQFLHLNLQGKRKNAVFRSLINIYGNSSKFDCVTASDS